MEDLRSGIERLKQAKAHMREANGIVSDCISQIKELEEENEQLKDEIAIIQPEELGFSPSCLYMFSSPMMFLSSNLAPSYPAACPTGRSISALA